MNTKQARELRRAIREQHPNINESTFKRIYKEAKRQYKKLNKEDKSRDVIEIK